MSGSKRYLSRDPMKKRENSIVGSRPAGKYYYRGNGYWSRENLDLDFKRKTGNKNQPIGYNITPKDTSATREKKLDGYKDYSHYSDDSKLSVTKKRLGWK